MKRLSMLSFFSLVALATPLLAVDYTTELLDPSGSNLWNTGVQVAGNDFGGANETGSVNGVNFGLDNVSSTAMGDIGGRNAASTYFSGGDAVLGGIMNDIVFNATQSVTFSGLTPGASYVAQFLSWDAEVEGEGEPGIDKELRHTVITSTIDGDSHIQEQIVINDGSMVSDISPVVTTAMFIATDSSATFDFNLDPARTFDDNTILNGATLFQVPEPSSLMLVLFSLAPLPMLRRRR